MGQSAAPPPSSAASSSVASPVTSPAAEPAPSARTLYTARLSSYMLMAAALLLIMVYGLLPGLLFVCLGFLLTQWLSRQLTRLARLQPRPARRAQMCAAGFVMLLPLLLVGLAWSQSRGYLTAAPQQYRELLDYMARTVLELRLKLPEDIAMQLPEGAAEIQDILANYLGAKAGALAVTGRSWLAGLLHAYVGLLIGALAAVRPAQQAHSAQRQLRPLACQLHLRVSRFGEAFRHIVAAQFWISAFNTLLTALFLLCILPLWGLQLPYTPALISLTFVAGLLPIVGNLVCNVVITIVALSVSPLAALACLGFLVLIHKAEYLINAKVVGQRTHIGVWELLCVMFVAEAVFGLAGLVAAPLFYAYLKKELFAARLV